MFVLQWLQMNELTYTRHEIQDDPLDEEWLRRVQNFRQNVRNRPVYHEGHPYVLHPENFD